MFVPHKYSDQETRFKPNSDTLVIHALDRSTDFLKPIYAGKGYDVLNSYPHPVNELLPLYKRVIMLGHGWTQGLFSVGKFPGAFSIDSWSATGLKGKDNVYIWCMASTFVHALGLKGFYTGMFISEVKEAEWFKIYVDQEAIDHSNHLFADIMSRQISHPNLQQILKEYDGDCPVIQYNRSLMGIS
jgi:hypothetical protein